MPPNACEMSNTPQLRRAEGANAAQWGGAQLRAIWHNIADAVKRNLKQDILKATQTSKRVSVTLRHPFGAASALKLAGCGRYPQSFAKPLPAMHACSMDTVTTSFTVRGAYDKGPVLRPRTKRPYPKEPREGKLSRVVREWRLGSRGPSRP